MLLPLLLHPAAVLRPCSWAHPCLQVLSLLLVPAGYELLHVTSGPETLQALQGCALLPDVLLLDVSMPGMNGLEVCEQCTSTRRCWLLVQQSRCQHLVLLLLLGRHSACPRLVWPPCLLLMVLLAVPARCAV